MSSKITYKNAKDKKIDFIYTYNNIFTIIIREDNLFIIIINDNKSPYISKWKLKYDDNILLIVSNDIYNKNLSQDHIDILINLTNPTNSEQESKNKINKINIMNKEYSYETRSIIDKTIKIINTTFYSKNKIQLGGYDDKFKLINKSLLVKLSILNRISHIDNLILSNIKNYIEDDYLDLLKYNDEKYNYLENN